MYIIVVGGGKIGFHLGKALLTEGHEILILEKDRNRIDYITNELGSICMNGDGCEVSTLGEAGAARANMLIAVTGDDEDNLVSSQVAKLVYKVPTTIARINNPKNEKLFKLLGVDITVSSTTIIMESIQQEVPTHLMTHLKTLQDRGLAVVEIRIPAKSKCIGKKIKNISLPTGSMLALVLRRDEEPQLITSETEIQTGDQIIALTPTRNEEALFKALS
ncbi:MAG TPA: NAD-binding protein [Dehalococcoidales bacterium]|nr:NAD-binding protein [Dehalococcoidales bacterium]